MELNTEKQRKGKQMSKENKPATQEQEAVTSPVIHEVEPEAKPDETRAEAFVRLANYRVSKTLDKIRLIGNLSSGNYEYTDEQIEKIEKALKDYIDGTMNKFKKNKKKEETCFEL